MDGSQQQGGKKNNKRKYWRKKKNGEKKDTVGEQEAVHDQDVVMEDANSAPSEDVVPSSAASKKGEPVYAQFENKNFVPRTTTNFLPKFDNQNDDKRLASLLKTTNQEQSLLYVSKKHSGCLIMAPPFYSKNATGNEFSRTGCVLLYEYFCAVWPGAGKEKFKQWWDDAETSGICYSFECVTPRILGDHGATPICAYMVLTCASLTAEERFLSPSELLQVATKWRLPLNEVWLIKGDKANAVESELHANRWTMQDSDASKILDKYLEGRSPQRFLSHGETQGNVLEGFVLMALEANLQEMTALIDKYNASMKPYHANAMKCAKRLGQEMLDHAQGKEFLKKVNQLAMAPLNMSDIYFEPKRLKGDLSSSETWKIVSEQTTDGRTHELFKLLRNLYSHSARLQPYIYKGNLQIQIHVMDDEVFYGWPLHMKTKKTGALFRGMVVTFYDTVQGGAPKLADHGFDASTPVKICGIAKLKCLNYMWRTFGVRNRLGILFRRGKEDYLRTLRKGFYPPWQIPQHHRKQLDWFFAQWADFALLKIPKAQQSQVQNGYLQYVEEFLKDCPFPLVSNDGEGATSTKKEIPLAQVMVVNLSGFPITNEQFAKLGLDPNTNQLADNPKRRGRFQVVEKAPKPGELGATNALLLFPPNKETLKNAGVQESQAKALHGMYQRYRSMEKDIKKKNSTMVVCENPATFEEWVENLNEHEEKVKEELELAKQREIESRKTKPKRLVLFTMALPPGGGKSSLFGAFKSALEHNDKNLSFCFRSSDDFKSRQPFENEFLRCVEGKPAQKGKDPSPNGEPNKDADVIIVGYDKNIPDMNGLQRLLTLIKGLNSRFNIRLLAIVPDRLDHDAFWERVKKRDPKTHIGLAIGDKLSEKEAYKIFRSFFFDSCEEFLPLASVAPFSIVSSTFADELPPGQTMNPLASLAEETIEDLVNFDEVGSTYEDVLDWSDDVGGGGGGGAGLNESAPGGSQKASPEKGNWCCADIEGHPKLHVTLVPPPVTKNAQKDPVRQQAMAKLRTMAGRSVKIVAKNYHIATLVEPEDSKKNSKRNRGRKRHSSLDLDGNAQKIAFWEVDKIEGLPDDIDLGEQMQVLHITDRASMTRGVKAKFARDVLAKMKNVDPSVTTDWNIQTQEHPLTVSATVSFYR